MDAVPGAHRRAVLEAALPGHLRVMYPGWFIWEAAGYWHAHRRGNFRQGFEPQAPQYALHADSPAGLWARLIVEMDKETILPIVTHAGEGDYRSEVPFRLPRRVHTQGNRRRDGTSAVSHLRLLQ